LQEGSDSYRNLFTFTQRKIEYENYRFKYPSLVAVVVESLPTQIVETQKLIGNFFYRFHVSDDVCMGELAEILKFKINSKIPNEELKLGCGNVKERILFMTNRISVGETQ